MLLMFFWMTQDFFRSHQGPSSFPSARTGRRVCKGRLASGASETAGFGNWFISWVESRWPKGRRCPYGLISTGLQPGAPRARRRSRFSGLPTSGSL